MTDPSITWKTLSWSFCIWIFQINLEACCSPLPIYLALYLNPRWETARTYKFQRLGRSTYMSMGWPKVAGHLLNQYKKSFFVDISTPLADKCMLTYFTKVDPSPLETTVRKPPNIHIHIFSSLPKKLVPAREEAARRTIQSWEWRGRRTHTIIEFLREIG